jgi:uncharacterized protein involved in exopolysaccharide biosynthesis
MTNMRNTNTIETTPRAFNGENIAAALFRRKRMIGFTLCGILGLAAALTMLLPKKYESSMKVLVKSQRADLVVSPDAKDSSYVKSEVTESQINSEIELLESYDLLARVVDRCHLYRPEGRGTVFEKDEKGFEKAVRKLKHDLKISPVRKSDFIEVTYAGDSPRRAAAVLRELSSAYLDMHLRVHRSVGTQEFFRNQASRYQTQLHEVEQRLNQFCQRNGLSSVSEQKDLIVRKVLDSETELKEAGTSLAETSRRVAELRKQLEQQAPRLVTQSRTIPNQYSIERLNTMLAELENRRTEALVKFRPEDRMVVELNQQIDNTRAALDKARKLSSTEQITDLNPLRTAIEGDLSREERSEVGLRVRYEQLGTVVAGYRSRLAQLEGSTLEYDNLKRMVKEAEENYLLYARKQEEARIADSLDQQKMANVAVAEAPVEHYLPTSPNIALNLILGATLAMILSLGSALAIEYSGGRLHTPQELELTTGVPVLVTVAMKKA